MNPKTLIIIDDSKACIASSLNAYQGERMFNDRFDLLEANRNLVSDEKYLLKLFKQKLLFLILFFKIKKQVFR